MTDPAQHATDSLVLTDVAALKALADPLRMRMLEEVTEPRTVKEMAAALGVPATRLYYHVKTLERHGLIRVVARRMVSGIEERTYQRTAESITVSDDLVSSLESSGVLRAMLDVTGSELELALRETDGPIGTPDATVPILVFSSFHLTKDRAAELQRRFYELVGEFSSRERGPETDLYHGLFTMYRMRGPDAS